MVSLRVAGNQFICGRKTYPCAIGRSGFSADKKEGDGCTPLGRFPLRECWYRADRLSAPETGLPLKIIHENDGWCDDPKSPKYNRHIKIFPSPYRGEGQGGGALGKSGREKEVPPLLAHAKNLRARMTEAEQKLWYHLRAHRFAGYGFRRQRPLGKYIVDFVCPKYKLVIELDGGQHANSLQDAKRDRFLENEGYRVLRFWNHEILENLDGVLLAIAEVLEITPSLTLPPEGGGENRSSLALPEGGGENRPSSTLSQRERGYSFEHLFRDDHVYDVIVPLGYNDDPVVSGRGSAIFLHAARDNYEPTAGCVALALPDLREVLKLCNPGTEIEIRG